MQTQILMESPMESPIGPSQQRTSLKQEKLDLTVLARNIVRDYAAVVKSHPIRFEGYGACLMRGNRSRLRRMLLGLLANAVEYSGAGREVLVSVWQSDSKVCLMVADEGIGIPTAGVERFFLPYRKLDPASDTAQSHGRGLATVQNIVQAHGGTISVQGDPEQGTTFEVCFDAVAD